MESLVAGVFEFFGVDVVFESFGIDVFESLGVDDFEHVAAGTFEFVVAVVFEYPVVVFDSLGVVGFEYLGVVTEVPVLRGVAASLVLLGVVPDGFVSVFFVLFISGVKDGSDDESDGVVPFLGYM